MRLTITISLLIILSACHKTHKTNNQAESTQSTSNKIDSLMHETIMPTLDLAINETSGLALIADEYWTVNDSGNDPSLYKFDIRSGKVLSEVLITSAENNDWESLAQDESYIYIGDFGNNTGGRDNLKIFKAALDDLSTSSIKNIQTITFKYPDQDTFYSGYNHNFDCEALISRGDSLYLFSKNWLDKKCKLYGLSKNDEDQTAALLSEFDSGGTITGASLHQSKKELYLLGYNGVGTYRSFLWVLSDWEGSDFFSGTKSKYILSIDRQTEGILVDTDGSLLISAEQNRGGHPSLYRVALK